MPTPPKPETKPTEPTKKTSDGVKAGQLFTKLTKLDAEEKAELANAPQSIHERFEGKRRKVLEGAEPNVKVLVERMRSIPAD